MKSTSRLTYISLLSVCVLLFSHVHISYAQALPTSGTGGGDASLFPTNANGEPNTGGTSIQNSPRGEVDPGGASFGGSSNGVSGTSGAGSGVQNGVSGTGAGAGVTNNVSGQSGVGGNLQPRSQNFSFNIGKPTLSVAGIAEWIVKLLNSFNVVIMAASLVVFLYGIFKLSFLDGTNPDAIAKSKKFMLWGIVSLFVMVSVWGLVNILKTSIFGGGALITPQLK